MLYANINYVSAFPILFLLFTRFPVWVISFVAHINKVRLTNFWSNLLVSIVSQVHQGKFLCRDVVFSWMVAY